MSALESRMVLHRFMCGQFGHKNLREMLDRLAGLSDQLDESYCSTFAQGILTRLPSSAPVSEADLKRYDGNITTHSQRLGITVAHNRTWKPFQYLALLFTERYLDLYFQDREALATTLNKWKESRGERQKAGRLPTVPDYTVDDLATLAFQSATGSGKTMLLHANILQYRHYLDLHQRLHSLNKIILVTPDEGLSRQHLRELKAGNIPAQLFSDGADVFSRGGAMVDIIDLHKLDEKKGVKRVALESFEENNLVLVDEGHLGTGGKAWRKRRKQLARNGFTFEYSATFNQAVSGGGEGIKALRDEYGKSILFDYSYKFFHADGYGKDYKISNLPHSENDETSKLYLLACLLTFYQQRRIYAQKGAQWREFNLAPPLWVFLGKTVTGGASAAGKETETDVVRIVKFLAWVHSEKQQVLKKIEKLTSGDTGLVSEDGMDIFSKSFPALGGETPNAIYEDLCAEVFHAQGQLHVCHLPGGDELQLSAGDARPYGVINVGEAAGLHGKLETEDNPLFFLSKNAFNRPLFDEVDSNQSPVNIVIGARKFVAGWSSWRVSTMGLMHVGKDEGPEIIQMFGRGVRLKGHGMSLKRHLALEEVGVEPDDSEQLKLLETLNIFGLKANYLEQFREYLSGEGIQMEQVTFVLPTKKRPGKIKGLKILKKRDGVREFQYSGPCFDLPASYEGQTPIVLDRREFLQVIESERTEQDETNVLEENQRLRPKHLALINKRTVYHKVLEHKRRFQWHNMGISQETVNELLDGNCEWYELKISPEKLALSRYGMVREWEELAADLIAEYADRYWRRKRDAWEHEHLEAVPLGSNNPNYVDQYILAVDKSKERLVGEISAWVARVEKGGYAQEDELASGQASISLLAPDFHLYAPLLCAGVPKDVQITPTPLNDGEANFVKRLREALTMQPRPDCLVGKEVYLMRNLSGRKGISFFDDHSFYPDFILWVKDSRRQDILFIDPKGLVHYNARTESKVGLHKRIKHTQEKIQRKNPDLFLHSYIWSNTSPKDIGADKQMSLDECHEKGIFIDSGAMEELQKMLEHALGND